MSNAVCCSSRSSCCPEHYVCDQASNLCAPAAGARRHSEAGNATTTTTIAATGTKTHGSSVGDDEPLLTKCPAGDTYCLRDNSTCCRQEGGSYGCCPDRDAVCCSDLVNCCPRGFACIRGTGNCVQTTTVARLAAGARRTAFRAVLPDSDMTEPLAVPAMRLERGFAMP
ncbi:progranulin-like [Dermacentor variabilis]|uniref:progranulin-like n=1 Tax=Dermacentor variabilis TaxID=34621 RepID=UPI003F5C85AA